MSDQSNDIAMFGINSRGIGNKLKGILDCMSEIQQFSVAEAGGAVIPERYFTLKDKLEYFMIGFKSTFMGGIISIIFIPLAIGVVENKIPAFGGNGSNMFDSFFVFLLALSFSIGYGLFFATIGQLYSGGMTKSMILNLFSGVTMASILKFIIAFVSYQVFYFILLKEENIIYVLTKFYHIGVSQKFLQKVYFILLDFKPILLSSTTFIFITTVLFISIPWISLGIRMFKLRGGRHFSNFISKK